MNYQNNFTIKDYFTVNYGLGSRPSPMKFKLKKGNIVSLIFGIILLIVGFAVIGDNTGLGIIFLLVSFGLLFLAIGMPILKKNKQNALVNSWDAAYNYRRNKWGAEFKKAYDARFNSLDSKNKAKMRLGITDDDLKNVEVEPFYISGNNYDGWWRQESNGKYNTDKNVITWIFFSEKQIYVYTVSFQMTNPNSVSESTQEFFYGDIVSVSTESTDVNTKDMQSGKTTSVSDESFKLVVPGDKLYFSMSTSSQSVRDSINNMKILVRNKKTGA